MFPAEMDLTAPLVANDRRLVCVPVKRLDERAVKVVEYALTIPAGRYCAIHVAGDRAATLPLAVAWMEADPLAPLVVVDDIGGVVASVKAAVEDELAGGAADEVVVVLSRPAARRRWWRPFDRGAERAERALSALPAVRVVVLGVPVR
jgi:hypothetical protein